MITMWQSDKSNVRITRAILVALSLLLLGAASCLADRTMVGFLPLDGKPGTYTHVIPELTCWALSRATSAGVVDTGAIVDCIQLDRLKIPSRLLDIAGNSHLAGKSGVTYLVRGVIEHFDSAEVRFRLTIYSAEDRKYFAQKTFQSHLSAIPEAASQSAEWISSELAIRWPGAGEIRGRVPAKAMALMDEALRLSTGCETDQSNINKASSIVSEARNLPVTNDAVSRWMRSIPYTRQRGLGRMVWSKPSSEDADNPTPPAPSYTIAADGRFVWRLTDKAWRGDLENIRDIRNNRDKMISYFSALSARHPNSAYMLYCAGRAFTGAGNYEAAAREYSKALRINPDSFRIRMRLVSTYIELEDIDKAAACLQPALKRWPDRSECYVLSESIFRAKQDYEKAAQQMKIAMRLDPTFWNRNQLIHDYVKAGKMIDVVRVVANTDNRIKRGMIIFTAVFVAIFLIGVLSVTILVKAVMRA